MKKTGTIDALNVSPKGFYEGILLSKGRGRIQVNLPKDEALMMAPSFPYRLREARQRRLHHSMVPMESTPTPV